MNKLKFFVALSCLLQMIQVHAVGPDKIIGPVGGTIVPNNGGCNEPAPTNYHISDYYTNELRVAWDAPANMPFEYNVKVFETSSGNLILNFNIPGNLTFARALSLQPGMEYSIRTAPVCPDGTISPNYAVSVGTTLIIDLVVAGFTVPNNPPLPATCAINDQGEYCNSQPDETYDSRTTIFKIRTSNNTGPEWYFGVYNPSGACDKIIIKKMTGETAYSFELVNQAKIIISLGWETVGEFSVKKPQGVNYSMLYCVSNTTAPYEIARFGVYYGYADSNGDCGNDRSYHASPGNTASFLTVAPNPFSDELNVQLSDLKGNVELGLYNLQGAQVLKLNTTIDDQSMINLNTSNIPTGMYFLRAETGGIIQTTKVIKSE